MSIRGDQASGYFNSWDERGHEVHGETRQCKHCQYTWVYKPGSGNTRGYCLSCRGIMCGRPECIETQKRLTKDTEYKCIPFEDLDKMRVENAYKSHPDVKISEDGRKVTIPEGYTMLPSGFVVPISLSET